MEREEQQNDLHQPFIEPSLQEGTISHEDGNDGCSHIEIIEEAKKQLWLAGPLITVNILQFCCGMISIMFVGYLGELSLSSASMATSFASVSGFSILLGVGSALETLCGQCYGAKQYEMLGIHTQRAMIVLTTLSIPIMFIWSYTENILIFFGQDHEISFGAGVFNTWMIPSIFAYGILQCLNRFLQTQNLVIPMMMSSGITTIFHILICWTLVFKLQMGIKGAAFANSISYWANVIMLAMYVKLSHTCQETWTGFSIEAVYDLLSFVKLAVPSAIMICFEFWAFEMVVLLSGLLQNPKLETSVLSISLNTCWTVYMISVGLGGVISTRVSNELGAANPKGARLALLVMISMALFEGLIVFTTSILLRNIWGKLYSNDYEVVVYVAKMMPLLAISDFLDGFQCVLSGAARGCGWQNACAFINLGAYYFVGIPCAIIFAFALRIGGMGLWIGIICGLLVQVVSLIILNLRTNWNEEFRNASLCFKVNPAREEDSTLSFAAAMATDATEKSILTLIRSFASEKYQGERRVMNLKKKLDDLRSDLDLAYEEVENAKRRKERIELEFKGYEVELAIKEASAQALEARITSYQDLISTVRSDLQALKHEEGMLRDEFIKQMIELNDKIRRSQGLVVSSAQIVM